MSDDEFEKALNELVVKAYSAAGTPTWSVYHQLIKEMNKAKDDLVEYNAALQRRVEYLEEYVKDLKDQPY